MQPTPPSESTSFITSILEKLSKIVRSVARRRGVPFQDFNDVAQRVSLDLARYPHNIPRDGDLRPWLQVVTEHKVVEYFRDHPRYWVSLSSGRIDATEQGPSVEEQLIAEQSRAVVRGEVERLAPEPRRVWKLRELEAMSLDEIAALEGVPVGTVSDRYRRAKAELTATLRSRARADTRKCGDRSFAFVPFLFWWCRDAAASFCESLIERVRASRPVLRFAVLALCLVCSTVPWHDGPVLSDGSDGSAAVEGDIAGQGDGAITLPIDGDVAPPGDGAIAPPADGAIALPAGALPAPLSSFISGDARPTGTALQAATVVLPSSGAPRPSAVDTARRVGGAALAPSPLVEPGRRFRDLVIPHECLIRAQEAADAGDMARARQALQTYDRHSPDNPLASLRSTVVRAMEAHRIAKDVAKPGAESQPEREEVQR